MSQPSDIYSVLLSENGEFDDSSYLFSESIVPEHSTSQTAQLPPPLSVPRSLKRSTDSAQTYVICEDMNKEQFVEWWIQTQSGHSEHQSTFWDRKGQRADIWADFEQVAHFVTGQPKVMCKHCGAILNHPNSMVHTKAGTAGKQGTTALRRHLERAICKTKGQSSIRRLLQKQASEP
jgi:hypothetical protein